MLSVFFLVAVGSEFLFRDIYFFSLLLCFGLTVCLYTVCLFIYSLESLAFSW